MKRSTAAWIAGSAVLICSVIGGANGPQKPGAALWYLRLRKPDYTPPGPAVGATWGVLEVLLALSGYRLLRARPSRSRTVSLGGWAMTLAGLAGYPWLFFRKQRLGASTVAAAAMLTAAATSAAAAQRVDRGAAGLSLPVVAWLAFATLLSDALRRRNG